MVVDPANRKPDYEDVSLTENGRVAYPVEFIPDAVLDGVATRVPVEIVAMIGATTTIPARSVVAAIVAVAAATRPAPVVAVSAVAITVAAMATAVAASAAAAPVVPATAAASASNIRVAR